MATQDDKLRKNHYHGLPFKVTNYFEFIARETRELMAQIMALPPPDGELFLRRYVYGETAAQLGVHFNMPAATVRTRLHRARLALQKLLKEG